ncbi:MAG: hypothetical protein K8F90_17765 [Hyphomicrobiales bacterium]|nr:hypothetical protein [Hyphomicrobiales bacterium]
MQSPRHDYDQIIADWMARPDADEGSGRKAHTGYIRTAMENSMREAGLSADELAREMAHFDAAAMRFLKGAQAAVPAAPTQTQGPSLPDFDEPLGFWRWLGVVWLALGWAEGAAATMASLLIPLNENGEISRSHVYGAAAAIGLIVLIAAVPFLANVVRRWRGIGFLLFWLPMFLFGYGVAVAPLTLLDGFIKSMGPDFLPLALPSAVAVFAVLALPSLWYVFRRLFGRAKPLIEPGSDDKIHPLLAILVAGFCVLFFTIGARVMLGWGEGPALVVGIFITGLFIRLYYDREVSWLFIPIVALPLALLAGEMPPSNLAAFTVLGLALAVGFIALVLSLARLRRRTVLFTSLTTAALALILVMAPTGPSPALWLNNKLGHPMKPLSETLMGYYAQAYETEPGHAVLAALDGYRSIAVSADIQHYDLDDRTIVLTVDFHNTGELGINQIYVDLLDKNDTLNDFPTCSRPITSHIFKNTLWPGDVQRVKLDWYAQDGCTGETLKKFSQHIYDGLGTYGWRKDLEIQILETRPVDARERFREDARAWLGL